MDTVRQLDHVVPPLRELVANTRPDQMTNPTPCARWNVRDLMNHLICGAAMFADAFGGAPTRDISRDLPDVAGDDPVAAFDQAVHRFQASLQGPGAMDRTLELPLGRLGVPDVLGFLAFDLLVHSWDLASATSQGFDPPNPLVRELQHTARTMVPDEARDGDTFAVATPVAPTASDLDRLVALSGRRT